MVITGVAINVTMNPSHAKFLFDRVNTVEPVDLKLVPAHEIIQGTLNKLRTDFPKSSTVTVSSRSDRSKVNYEQLETKLRTTNVVGIFGLTSSDQLYALLLKVNNVFLHQPSVRAYPVDFAAFPHPKQTTGYAGHWSSCHTARFMLGIYPNYEWVDELVGTHSYFLRTWFPDHAALVKYFTA